MRKSVVFLSFVAALAMWSCCGKSTQCESECQDSTAMKQEVRKECADKNAMQEQWAKFESLAVEEQEALLAKRAECFGKKKAACDQKAGECKDGKKECSDKEKAACDSKMAAIKKVMNEIDAEWANFEKMTIAEKKAFFDKVDALMTKAKDECASAEKKDCGQEKSCSKDGGKKDCSKDGGKKDCSKGGDKKDCCKNK